MSRYTITIDGGTTNTRCVLWDSNRNKIDVQNRNVGVRNTAIDGNNSKLKNAVKESLNDLVRDNSITYDDISLILASGMLTSDVGLTTVPHISAPAGAEDLAKHTSSILLEDVCPVPITFIPGIKNNVESVNLDNFEQMDIMRGEEVESIAIIEKMHTGKPMILVLPGSHNKFIAVDENKRITGCITSISGELLASITNDTIIAGSVKREFVTAQTYDKSWILTGYNNAKKTGLGRACFSARILNLFVEDDHTKIANYVLGAVMQSDINALMNSGAITFDSEYEAIVCGKDSFQSALVDILESEHIFSNVTTFIPPKNFSASAYGAYLIAEKIK